MLRLGLATPKPAADDATPEDTLRQAFCLAASLSEDKRGRQSSWSSEQESTTASSSELEEDSSGNNMAVTKVPSAKSSGGSFVRLPPGLQAPPGTPSHGSSLHRVGNCWPCAHYWKPSGCPKQQDCAYCHLCPDGEMKTRKRSKQAMMRLGLATPKVSNHERPDECEELAIEA